jgi:hypothetical protein
MQCPAQLYAASLCPYAGIPEPQYPFHDRTALVTCCGRSCLYRKKINLSKSLAGRAVGIKEVDDGIWLISFMNYDLGYIDLDEPTLQPLENPPGQKYRLCLRNNLLPMCPVRTIRFWSVGRDSKPATSTWQYSRPITINDFMRHRR